MRCWMSRLSRVKSFNLTMQGVGSPAASRPVISQTPNLSLNRFDIGGRALKDAPTQAARRLVAAMTVTETGKSRTAVRNRGSGMPSWSSAVPGSAA